MLLGKFTLPMNADGSFVLPLAYRKSLPGVAYLTQGFDRNLLLLPGRAFEKTCSSLTLTSITDPLARLLNRLLLGNAIEIPIGSDSIIRVPSTLCKFADLVKDIVLVGQGEYVELWSPSVWEEQSTILRDHALNAQRFEKFHLALAG